MIGYELVDVLCRAVVRRKLRLDRRRRGLARCQRQSCVLPVGVEDAHYLIADQSTMNLAPGCCFTPTYWPPIWSA